MEGGRKTRHPQVSLRIHTIIIAFFVLLTFFPANLFSKPTSISEAKKAIRGWLKSDSRPLGMGLGRQITNVETFPDDEGQPIYYVVYLQPSGFIIVPADDLVEPIICFVRSGRYNPSDDNPLGALVGRDIPGRIAAIRELQASKGNRSKKKTLTEKQRVIEKASTKAKGKWAKLQRYDDKVGITGISSISDVWVSPLAQSKWGQTTVCGMTCYNYYTPSNYPCGCVATAMAQLMRYHQHPGTYSWGNMPLQPNCGITPTQRQTIGDLCYDAAESVETSYGAGGSGAYMWKVRNALPNTFSYSNAINGWNNNFNIGAGLNGMVNPNLDAGHPVMLGIRGGSYGHAVLTDGYGYNSSTLYHHLNMGWNGYDDAWYNLPNINCTPPSYDTVEETIYNVFVSGTGEIISGRITDDDTGDAISGATVTAVRSGGGTYGGVTNSNGIYALAKVPSASTYTISVTKSGYDLTNQIVTTGTSSHDVATSGNRWGIDFSGTALLSPPMAEDSNISAEPGIAKIIELQANDEGLPDPPAALTYIIESLPVCGILEDPCAGDINSIPYTIANNNNQVIYTSGLCYSGPDSFYFKANDGGTAPDGGDSNTATVSIEVTQIETVTIGAGTSTWDFPLHTFYHDSRTQVIYLAGEIGGSGIITGLSLDVATVPGQTMNNWTIRMKQTAMSSYSTNSLDATGWTVVYQANEPVGSTGWRPFTFSTPFDYNDSSNLLVDFSHNNTSYTTSGMCRYSTPGGTRSVYAYSDSGYGDPLGWSGTSAPTVYGTTKVPNIKLIKSVATEQIAGDFEPDCIVDIYDLGIFCSAWLSSQGNGNWNPACDISEPADNFIDFRDYVVFGENWLASTD